jgi:NAD(P)-dependent dehydrogenase (short-subunit alcohol dehydrogenase family)
LTYLPGVRRPDGWKRVAQPEDIAGATAFLASDAALWVPGDTVRVDGGSKP